MIVCVTGAASAAETLFDEGGRLTNAATRKFLQQFMEAFAAWVDRFKPR